MENLWEETVRVKRDDESKEEFYNPLWQRSSAHFFHPSHSKSSSWMHGSQLLPEGAVSHEALTVASLKGFNSRVLIFNILKGGRKAIILTC